MLEQDIKKILVSREEIQATVRRLGQQLTQEYQNDDLVVVGILRGAALFMIDLVREMDVYLEIDFMDVSSYGDALESSGTIRILKDLETDVENRHVLVVEDIIDTGRTLNHVVELLHHRKAKSVKVCALLDKPSRRIIKEIEADYVGVEIPDEFVVGYGLDYKQKYRNLPFVGILKEEIYQKS